MRRSMSRRQRGELQVTDLIIGLILAVAIPVGTRLVIGMSGVGTRSKLGTFQEKVEVPEPAPERSEVDARLAHCRRLWSENASVLLTRAEGTEGLALKNELTWARAALHAVNREATHLESLIQRTGVEDRYAAVLQEIQTLKKRVQAGLDTVKSLDPIGVLK